MVYNLQIYTTFSSSLIENTGNFLASIKPPVEKVKYKFNYHRKETNNYTDKYQEVLDDCFHV